MSVLCGVITRHTINYTICFYKNLLVSEDMTLLSSGAQVVLAAGLLNTTL